MKKTIGEIAGRIFILASIVCIIVSGVSFLKGQKMDAHQNPITKKQDKPHIPIVENTKTQVNQDILDMDAQVKDAQNEQADGNSIPTSKEQMEESVDGSETKKGNDNPNNKENEKGSTPGGGAFDLPADGNYFLVNLIDVKDPYKIDDPRCYYKITHLYPQLTVEKVVFYNNGKVTPYYANRPEKGFINLEKGENWIKVRVTYRLPNGTLETYERAANPPMVRLQDPKDIDFSNTNLKNVYENPDISFYVKPNPENANVQVFMNGRLTPVDKNGNYNLSLIEGENQVTFKGSANGYHSTELSKRVIYKKTGIKVYSEELASADYRKSGQEYLKKKITFSTKVEYSDTGLPVKGVLLDITLRGKLVYSSESGSNESITLDLPLGINQIVISARGKNIQNNGTEFVSTEYRILTGQSDPVPENVQKKTSAGTTLAPESVVHDPVLDFRISPTTIDSLTGHDYAVTEHKQYVYHTSNISAKTPVLCRENIMGVYCYSVYLSEGRNEIELVLVTDELYKVSYKYVVYYIPNEDKGEKKGRMFISMDASVIGMGLIVSGYVDFYKDKPLSYAVLDLLKQNGFQANYTGESNYSMYLSAVMKTGMLSGWDESKISAVERALIEDAGGDTIWHGSYNPNSLGAGDFTSRSGWVATLNGNPIRGLSYEMPKDGDICKLIFTLTGGSDVGVK